MILHQFANRTVVYMITHALFCFDFIPICYGYIVHLIAETDNQHVLCISPCGTNTHPYGNLVLSILILPITYNYFTADTHTGTDVSEFAVAVSRLVQVHKVHIHGIPRYLFVELSVEVKQRLFQLLQTVYPHFSR